jgi:hypothetical protein
MKAVPTIAATAAVCVVCAQESVLLQQSGQRTVEYRYKTVMIQTVTIRGEAVCAAARARAVVKRVLALQKRTSSTVSSYTHSDMSYEQYSNTHKQ